MYKPPENSNRVKSIKNKFENIDKPKNANEEDKHNFQKVRNNVAETKNNPIQGRMLLVAEEKPSIVSGDKESQQIPLERQLSDPSKRNNIKRTPAFRLEKTSVVPFQRGNVLNQSQNYNVLKPLNATKSNDCCVNKTRENSDRSKNNKPILYKSKSSIDFNEIRNRFNCESENVKEKTNQRDEICRIKNASALYTEPIPKSLRAKNNRCDKNEVSKPVYSNLQELSYLNDNEETPLLLLKNDKKNDIHNSSTLKLDDKKKENNNNRRISKQQQNIDISSKNISNSNCRNPKNNLYISTDSNHGGIPNGKLKNYSIQSTRKNEFSGSAIQKLDTLLELTKSNSLKKSNVLAKPRRQLELSDTIKNALKKPLPKGPPPKKPPRTFEHCFESQSWSENDVVNVEKNTSFLHVSNFSKKKDHTEKKEKSTLRRSDPKYMLDKLETALRSNKILRNKKNLTMKAVEVSSTTSGEDSDEINISSLPDDSNNLLLSSKNNNNNSNSGSAGSPTSFQNDNNSFNKNKNSNSSGNLLVQALNFNCGFCVSSPYSKLNGSKSSLSNNVSGRRKEEPVYAEPWHFEDGGGVKLRNNNLRARSVSSDRNSKDRRSSLYYLSSPVCGTPRCSSNSTMNISNSNIKQIDVPLPNEKCRSEKCASPEIPSSVTSQSSTPPTTPMDDTDKSIIAASLNIKKLIDCFEKRNSIDEKTSNSSRTSWYIDDEDNEEEEEEPQKQHVENHLNTSEKAPIGIIEEKESDIDVHENRKFDVPDIRLDGPNDVDAANDDIDVDNSSRLDDLRDSIAKTIENSFDVYSGSESDNNRNNSDRKMSVEDPTVSKFIRYVRNVSVYAKTRPSWKKSTLFDCCLIVEMNADVRRIKFKYPFNVQVPHKIEDLCFPETACGPVDKTTNAQCYSLVITDEKGERTFGYCRRVVPEGSNKCLPIAYCILSKYKCPRFYRKILVELESRHGISEFHRNNLLRAFYYNKFPQPGETLTIKLTDNVNIRCMRNKENYQNCDVDDEDHRIIDRSSSTSLEDSIESNFVIVNERGEYEPVRSNSVSGSKDQNDCRNNNNNNVTDARADFDVCEESGDIKLNLHYDPVYEISDLKDLHELPIEIIQKIFASLLLERKVILISCLLSKLSSCVEALQAIVYPFTWPHSFIPVLPRSLWEFVEAPTPIICGIMSVDVVNKHEIEYGIVVDLDEKCILKEEGDEDKVFCNSLLKTWRRGIVSSKNNSSSTGESNSQPFCDAYVNMFAMALRNYRDYIVNGNFQKEAFIRSGRTKGVRRFLKWFTDTSMFLTFVEAVITNSQDFSIFDKKIVDYEQESTSLTFNKLLDWNK